MQRFTVQGMTCGHCANAVNKAIKGEDPAAVVDVDLTKGEVRVESELAAQRIIELIVQEGYEAQVV